VTVADALMLALGAIAVGSGVYVVTSAHLVRAGFYLVVSLGAVAGLYLVLGAELVAWVQILVYVGAVVVLLLFAVMLTRAPIGPSKDLDRPVAPAALIGGGVGLGLTVLLVDAFRWTEYELPPPGTGRRVGEQIFGAWVLPFEVLSILLLAALVGAIVLSRPDIGARPDPGAAAVPDVPPPGPVDESAEVKARLERIAARQAAARERMRAAESPAPGEAPPLEKTREDVLKEQAHDVVFRAGDARPKLGVPELPELSEGSKSDSRVIEGTSREDPERALPPSTNRALPRGEDRALPQGENRALPQSENRAPRESDEET
jgi:NADH:ubiquinone oxidoreductase subunit 6 (subunit J)